MPHKSKILLTGATGFVGTQILRALLSEGHFVRAISRQHRADILAQDVVVTADLFSEEQSWWSDALTDIDIVIHAAWYVEPGRYLTSPKNHDCLVGSLRLADAFIRSKASHFVGIGSCFEYDLSGGKLDVQTPLAPRRPYTKAKVALYRALGEILPIYGKSFGWHRLFYLYGEGEKPGRLVSNLHRHMQAGLPIALTEGNQVRDFLDVKRAGEQIATAALNRVPGPYNICSGSGRSIRQIAEEIADLYGRRDLLQFGARAENPIDPPVIVGVPGNRIAQSQ